MILSEKYRFLFIHIPKTGGTSLHASLIRYGRPVERLAHLGNTIPVVRTLINAATKGDPIRQITGLNPHAGFEIVRSHFGRDQISDLFSFAITRNPFTRVKSFYDHAQRIPGHAEHDLVSRLSFPDYVIETIERDRRSDPRARRLTQLPFLTDWSTGKIAVKGLLAMERLEEDIPALKAQLKLPHEIRLKRLNTNPSQSNNLETLFGDALKPFAEELSAEFHMLGYSTDISDAGKPPNRPGITI